MRKNSINSLAGILAFILLIFTGCQREISVEGTTGTTSTPPDLASRVNSSVSGFVTNENNLPVLNATVQVGSLTVTTDKYGFFEARNVSVIKNAATVTVKKTGYFNGIKTFIAAAGKSAFFRIKLIPKTNSGTVSGNTGGTITLSNGLSITFPASAVVTAATNAAYTGTVNVAAYWINPTSNEIYNIMPGDLRGINTAGNLQLLATYGMAAVELTGAGGELLQIASGKKASLSMPIPSSQSASAPASIPLWYFDEILGLWKQEGSAAKTGSNYVGDVSHFSFWNCDVPDNYVQFSCTFVNTAGQPIPYAYVKATAVSAGVYFSDYGYTDSTGYVSGYVPDNAQIRLDLFDNSNCSNAAYTQTFNTTNVNISLGTITLSTSARIATLSGTVKDCSNAVVTNGYIIISDGSTATRHRLSNTGTYSINKVFCSFPANISFVGEDVSASQQSSSLAYTVAGTGVQNIPDINACGVNTQQFFNFTDNGAPSSYSSPVDSFYMFVTPNPGTLTMYARSVPLVATNYATITCGWLNPAVGNTFAISTFATFPSASYMLGSGGTITITEYGGIGQFIAGTFTVSKNDLVTGMSHTYTGSFRIRRTQ